MGLDELISVLWRRRVIYAIATALALAAVVAVTLSVAKTYQATATVFVGQPIKGDLAAQTLDSTQAEQLSRTFTTLATSPETAETVVQELEMSMSRTELLDRVSINPVERTQLLEIGAEDDSPEGAADIANTYADVFVEEMVAAHEEGRVPTTVAISARAVEPDDPAKPNIPLYIGFGLILSLLLGAVGAVARDRLDRSVRVGKHAESLLGEPILARVPSAQETMRLPVQQRLAREQLTDALRVLRTNIELSPGVEARAIVVTSPATGEGKTTVARELALTIAADGDSVALVELDLRRPRLDLTETGTGIKRSATGISEVLAGRVELADATHVSSVLPGLAVVFSGSLGANPARLLRGGSSAATIKELRQRYDWVVFDSPPVLIADDVLLLTHHVDGAVMVVDTTKTPLPTVRSSIARLRKVDCHLLGLILNRTEAEASPYYMATKDVGMLVGGKQPPKARGREPAAH